MLRIAGTGFVFPDRNARPEGPPMPVFRDDVFFECRGREVGHDMTRPGEGGFVLWPLQPRPPKRPLARGSKCPMRN